MKLKKLLAAVTCIACAATSLFSFSMPAYAEDTKRGDVNGDGTVDSSDATMILIEYASVLIGEEPYLDVNIADMNNDGTVDSSDATAILIQYAQELLAQGKNINDYEPLADIWYSDDWEGGRISVTYNDIRETAASSPLNSAPTASEGRVYQFYNSQVANSSPSDKTVSNDDLRIIQNFANSHFGANWTKAEKVLYTLYWIHCNVDYDEEYKNIGHYKGYADCIFNGKIGQCLQYNGALAEVMAYLGYDVNLVQGYTLGGRAQHFWTEIKINGTYYVMETGNEDSQGSWMNFCVPYGDALGGYTKKFDHAD